TAQQKVCAVVAGEGALIGETDVRQRERRLADRERLKHDVREDAVSGGARRQIHIAIRDQANLRGGPVIDGPRAKERRLRAGRGQEWPFRHGVGLQDRGRGVEREVELPRGELRRSRDRNGYREDVADVNDRRAGGDDRDRDGVARPRRETETERKKENHSGPRAIPHHGSPPFQSTPSLPHTSDRRGPHRTRTRNTRVFLPRRTYPLGQDAGPGPDQNWLISWMIRLWAGMCSGKL